jgi:mannose-6-phosphate isomerase-like protein (cupin superfamily)
MNNIFHLNIEKETLNNKNYRKVLFTTKYMQIVIMALKPSDYIPMEIHENHDQFIRIEKGNGLAIIDGKKYILFDGISIIIPSGQSHKIINTCKNNYLKLYTIYSPPEHENNTIQKNNPELKFKIINKK